MTGPTSAATEALGLGATPIALAPERSVWRTYKTKSEPRGADRVPPLPRGLKPRAVEGKMFAMVAVIWKVQGTTTDAPLLVVMVAVNAYTPGVPVLFCTTLIGT